MIYLGDFSQGDTIYFKWSTTNQEGGSITRGDGSPGSPSSQGEIRVYKNDSLSQIGSPSGITDSPDFDDLEGVHHVTIDTSVDSTFYSAGADFQVVVAGETIDEQAVNAVIAHFSIQNRFVS
jgi:hypothetical protein